MQIVRTTITLPKDLYEEIRTEAFEQRKSFNKAMLERLEKKVVKKKANRQIMAEMKRLAKGVDTKGIDYKALINEGRKY